MKNKKPDSRPVYLNLLRIRQPVTAIASIGHRISGVLIFLSLPFVIWLMDAALSSPEGFKCVADLLDMAVVKIYVLLLAWALWHHLLAGVRFLLLDIDVGIELSAARASALWVNIGGVLGLLATMAVIL